MTTDKRSALIAKGPAPEVTRAKEDIMRTIRKKTYNNFMYVMKQVQNKGYDFCEAEQMTHRIFDQVESCPEGLSVMRLVEMIVAKEA